MSNFIEDFLRRCYVLAIGRHVTPAASGMLQVNRSIEWFGTHAGSFGIRAQATSYGPMYVWPASDSAEPPAMLTTDGDANLFWSQGGLLSTLGVSFDGGSSVLTVSKTADLWVPFAFTIKEAVLLSKETGSVQVGVWATSYGNYPPTSANTITASATPLISSSNKYKDTTLTGWTTTFASDMCVRFNVDSVSSIKQAVLTLKIIKGATGLQGGGGDYGQGAVDDPEFDPASNRGGGNGARGADLGGPWVCQT